MAASERRASNNAEGAAITGSGPEGLEEEEEEEVRVHLEVWGDTETR